MKDCLDWMPCPSVFLPPDQPEAGTSGGGPVCQQTDSTAAHFCDLETRPIGNGHRCLHSELGQAQGIYQPSVEPDKQHSCTDMQAASRACSSGSSLEGTGMVPSATGDAGEITTSDPSEEGSGDSHTPGQPSRGGPQLAVWAIFGCILVGPKIKACRRSVYLEDPLSCYQLLFWGHGV